MMTAVMLALVMKVYGGVWVQFYRRIERERKVGRMAERKVSTYK